MQSRTNAVNCPACKQAVPAARFLDACSGYWAALELVHFTCPLCNSVTETRLRPGAIEMGYTYAAGSAHFCSMIEVSVPGLEVQADTGEMTIELGEQRWNITPILAD